MSTRPKTTLNRHRPFSVPLTDAMKRRIEALAAAMTEQAEAAGLPGASAAYAARACIEIGLDALERRHAAPKRSK